jgi:hypothetical protein
LAIGCLLRGDRRRKQYKIINKSYTGTTLPYPMRVTDVRVKRRALGKFQITCHSLEFPARSNK